MGAGQVEFQVREAEVPHYPWRVFEVVRSDGFVKSVKVKEEDATKFAARLNMIAAQCGTDRQR